MGKQISKNIPRILALFVVAILISSLGVASKSSDDWNSGDSHSNNPQVDMRMDSDGPESLGDGDWMGFLKDFHPENVTHENKTSDRDNNYDGHGCNGPSCGGPGYGGYGGAVVPIPMYGGPMGGPMGGSMGGSMGGPMYGSEPSMLGSEPSTIATAVPLEPTVCKSKVSSSKCHKDKCALSKHKHKHKHHDKNKHHDKKHKAKKHC